jgi:hypothetical protein
VPTGSPADEPEPTVAVAVGVLRFLVRPVVVDEA